MPTREIYRIGNDGSRTYAGYARFDDNGNYQGSFAGYGPQRRGINSNRTGNARTNNTSRLQNAINRAGAATAARRRRAYGPIGR